MYLSNLFVVDGCVDQSKQYRIGVTIDQQHIYGVGSKKCAFDFDSLSVQWEISTGDKITNTSNSGGSTTGAISISTTSNPSTSPAIDKHSISTLKTCTSRPQVSTTTPHNNGYSIILNSTSPDSNGGIGSTDPEKTISKASVMSSQTLTAIIVLTVVTLLMTILCVVVFVCYVFFFCLYLFFFFFKQKTAYEIVSRDWSSDVCSSDLSFYHAHFSVRQRPCFLYLPILAAVAPPLFIMPIFRCGSAPTFYTYQFSLRQPPPPLFIMPISRCGSIPLFILPGSRCGSAPAFFTDHFSLRQRPRFLYCPFLVAAAPFFLYCPVLVAAAPPLFLLTISRCGSAPSFYTVHFSLRQRPRFLYCPFLRSEGRRVGKECRSRWSPYH